MIVILVVLIFGLLMLTRPAPSLTPDNVLLVVLLALLVAALLGVLPGGLTAWPACR